MIDVGHRLELDKRDIVYMVDLEVLRLTCPLCILAKRLHAEMEIGRARLGEVYGKLEV